MNSRLNRKKKSNTILNILIAIVLLLIIVTVVNIVKDDDKTETAVEQNTSNSSKEQKEETEEKSSDAEEEASSTEETNTQQESGTDSNSSSTIEENASEENNNDSIVSEQSSDPNVEEVIVDSAWQPIGTSQTGDHVSSYDKSSIDWAEKVEALSYASGLDSSNMYVKFLGNGGSPQKSIGTVTSKDGKEIYRIYLDWVDGQGWKPTKKEKLTTLEDAS